MKESEEFY